MNYLISQLVVDNKKKCIKILESLFKCQKDSVEMMLDVVKSDCQNKLEINSILGPPGLEEWKSVYTKIGWEYIEAEQKFVDPVPRTFTPVFSKSGKEMFPNDDKEKTWNGIAYYDEMVGNYETYKFCIREHHETFDVIQRIEPIRENLDLLDYEYIEHDEALCFLLGINANLPSSLSLSDKKLITVFKYEDDPYDDNVSNFLFKTKENKKLTRKFGTPTINKKEFIEWALEEGYIEEANKEYLRDLDNDPYEKEFSELLYKELRDRNLICGEYYEKWQWQTNYNSLKFLAMDLHRNTLPRIWYAKNPIKFPNWDVFQHYFDYPKRTLLRQLQIVGDVERQIDIENVVDALIKQVNDPHGRKEF